MVAVLNGQRPEELRGPLLRPVHLLAEGGDKTHVAPVRGRFQSEKAAFARYVGGIAFRLRKGSFQALTSKVGTRIPDKNCRLELLRQ